MVMSAVMDKCPTCGKPCPIDEWKHSESGRRIQALSCVDCNADFGRYAGDTHWQLIYKGRESDDE